MAHFDANKTLEELDGEVWEQKNHDSHLVETCYKLRKKPLIEFSIEDLRMMIGQNISLEYLIPLALERLAENPFAEGDYYKGDLLVKVLIIREDFWRENPNWHDQLDDIVHDVKHTLETLMPLLQNYKSPN